jgi:D-amino-acid dehydrogenase
VIGGGIIGLASALSLQEAGFQVRVIDRGAPGDGASYGNAGILAPDGVIPESNPATLAQVPRYLLDPTGPLTIRWRHLPRLIPWLARFVAAGRPSRVAEIASGLAALTNRAVTDYAPLTARAGADGLIKRGGSLTVYRSAEALDAAASEHQLRRRHGHQVEIVTGAALREMEPALSPAIQHAAYFPEKCWVIDPRALSQAFADAVLAAGGDIVRAAVNGFALGADGPDEIFSDQGTIDITDETVVIAAGAQSLSLTRLLGAKPPLDTERGYHVMVPRPGISLGLPVSDGGRGYYATPMAGGLRIAGTVELGGLTAPPNWRRADILLGHARRLLPDLDTAGSERWMGFRPSMPDSLPVISRSPRFRRVLFAFGHGHLGLTLAAVTGRLVADLAADKTPIVDPRPYRVDRF